MGISMGGAIAVMSSDLELPESVCGIVDDAGFTSPLEMIKIGSKEKLRFELLTDLFARIVNAAFQRHIPDTMLCKFFFQPVPFGIQKHIFSDSLVFDIQPFQPGGFSGVLERIGLLQRHVCKRDDDPSNIRNHRRYLRF